MLEIPLRKTPSQSFQIVLNGQNCTLSFHTRTINHEDRLYCDIQVGTEPVIVGVACQDMNGLKLYGYLGFVGQLAFVDMQGDEDPHWSGLGDRWRLCFRYPEEDDA